MRFLLTMVAMLVSATALAEGQARFDRFGDARVSFWNEIYADGGDTLYCGEAFLEPTDLTIEHVFPIAWMVEQLGCMNLTACRERSPEFNRMEADLHNLWPARIDAKTLRGGLPFGEIPGGNYALAGCGLKISGVVDPRPQVRGNIARAMLYMANLYGAELPPDQIELMKRWDRQDPPDAGERTRNNRIEAIQGTRNRFIDSHRPPAQ